MNKRIHDNITKHEEETRALEKQCNDMLETANSEMREMREQCRVDVATAREERREMEYKYESLFTEHERVTEAKTLCEARLKAMRAQQGLMTDEDDFTERESFGVLEKEFKAFERFYNSQWSKTKKKIRKSILNKDNLISRKRHK